MNILAMSALSLGSGLLAHLVCNDIPRSASRCDINRAFFLCAFSAFRNGDGGPSFLNHDSTGMRDRRDKGDAIGIGNPGFGQDEARMLEVWLLSFKVAYITQHLTFYVRV